MTDRAYDPELAPLIPLLPSTDMDWNDMEGARAGMADLLKQMGGGAADDPSVAFADRVVPGPPDAPELSLRVYTPAAASDGARPGILYIHGGGFCFGSVDFEHQGALVTARDVDAVVASVEYRLAPEHPFPAGLEDCYAALQWLAGAADELGVDPERIAVMGQSAGGGLAAGLALLARDRGGPPLCFQMLGIPELDHRLETHSMQEFTDTPLWNRPNAVMSWRFYLGEESPGEVSPYASPAIAKDLAGLPPAFVNTMEFDPLRDEGIEYALRLLRAGVPVELHQYPGTFHGSSLFANVEVSKRGQAEMIAALRKALHAR